MAVKIIWSPKAVETFDAILSYLADKWTEKEIKKFVSKTARLIYLISIHPRLFPESIKRKNQHKAVIVKQVSLIYRHKSRKNEIELVTFWDNRMNPDKLIN